MNKTFKTMEANLSTKDKDYTAFGGFKKFIRKWALNPTAEVSLEVQHSLRNRDRTETDLETIKDINVRILETRLEDSIKASNKIVKRLKKTSSRKEKKNLREDLESTSYTIKYYRKELTKARRK